MPGARVVVDCHFHVIAPPERLPMRSFGPKAMRQATAAAPPPQSTRQLKLDADAGSPLPS